MKKGNLIFTSGLAVQWQQQYATERETKITFLEVLP